MFLCDIAFKALLTTQMSMFLFNHILGEKTHIKRFELSEKKRKRSKVTHPPNFWITGHTHTVHTHWNLQSRLHRRAVSALYGICSFIAMRCVYIVFWLSVARLIRLHKLYKAFVSGSLMEKELNKRLFPICT